MILVVEDCGHLRASFAEALAGAGYGAIEAANGHEAVVKATALRPQLIVLDLSLPMLGARDTLRVLRSQPRTRDILVLALAGHALAPDELEELDGALRKPCMPDALVFAVQGLLALARRSHEEGSALG